MTKWEITICCHVEWYREGGLRDTVDWIKIDVIEDFFVPRRGDTLRYGEDDFDVLQVCLDYRTHKATVYVEVGLEEGYFDDQDMEELVDRLKSFSEQLG